MIWLDSFDLGLLGALCCVIGVGYLFREKRTVCFVVVGILFCVGFGSGILLSMGPPRSLFDTVRRHTGTPREEFYQGVREGGRLSQLVAPYVILSTAGLALMGVIGYKRGRNIAEQGAGADRGPRPVSSMNK